jgi:hypothetical protein
VKSSRTKGRSMQAYFSRSEEVVNVADLTEFAAVDTSLRSAEPFGFAQGRLANASVPTHSLPIRSSTQQRPG